jgi:hypothetical protein
MTLALTSDRWELPRDADQQPVGDRLPAPLAHQHALAAARVGIEQLQ